MPATTNKIFTELTTLAGWGNNVITPKDVDKLTSSNTAFKHFIAKNTFDDKNKIENKNYLNVDAIYFTDNYPVIYFKQLAEYTQEQLIEIQQKFWNECRTPLTVIITPSQILILDNYETPKDNQTNFIIKQEQYSTSAEDLNRLAQRLHQSKLDSEQVIGISLNLKTDNRVDKKLIKQLKDARLILHNTYKLPFSIIHDILGRSLFTLYLEQRDILTREDIIAETGLDVSFFDLLDNHPAETIKLFEFLKEKFNGDLFPISVIEEENINANPEILKLVCNCFTGRLNHSTKQFTIQYSDFHLFDFKYIPIELISAIYEEFMAEEDAVKNKIIDPLKKSKNELGAYYTPQMLVEFVYNEVLPMPSKNDCNYNIKILDPACGSGIFLVEGFKRIIERYKYDTNTDELDKDILTSLLKNNIYGIDINAEAIKITAFSLYLTYINYMNPRKILRQVKFNPLINWTTPKEIEVRQNKKFGTNLLQASTFILETADFRTNPNKSVSDFFNTTFDIVIGNPPWKAGHVDASIINWGKSNNWELRSDIVKGYLAYIPSIAPHAKIALISSAKVLFNTSGSDDRYRQRFFKDYKVELITNFSVVRNDLFEKAKQACALIIYQNRNGIEYSLNESIPYVTPKTKEAIKNRNAITIDASEIKYLPITEVLKSNTKIFKIAMFGNMRDLNFIDRLNILKDQYINSSINGMGLIKDKDAKNKGNYRLADYNFIEAESILPYYTPKSKSIFKTHKNYNDFRTDNRDIFNGPLVLFKEGTKFGELCCSYIDYNCVFLTNAQSIKFLDEDASFYKSYVACLNSSLATYFFISIGGSWGVSKGGILQKNEAQLFPVLPYLFSKKTNELIANELDEIIKIIKSNNFDDLLIRKNLLPIKDKIDQIIYKELNITKEEQALIVHTLNYSNVIKANYKDIATKPVGPKTELKIYAETYLSVVNKHLKNSAFKLSSEIYTGISNNDDISCIHFKFTKLAKSTITYNSEDISQILKNINSYLHNAYSTSIEYRKILKYQVNENEFYLLKPNQKRFWSQAQALTDADALILEILNSRKIK